jgi:hypothetical protein
MNGSLFLKDAFEKGITDIVDVSFRYELRDLDLSNFSFTRCSFIDVNFQNTDMGSFDRCLFSGCDLRSSIFTASSCVNNQVSNCRLDNVYSAFPGVVASYSGMIMSLTRFFDTITVEYFTADTVSISTHKVADLNANEDAVTDLLAEVFEESFIARSEYRPILLAMLRDPVDIEGDVPNEETMQAISEVTSS